MPLFRLIIYSFIILTDTVFVWKTSLLPDILIIFKDRFFSRARFETNSFWPFSPDDFTDFVNGLPVSYGDHHLFVTVSPDYFIKVTDLSGKADDRSSPTARGLKSDFRSSILSDVGKRKWFEWANHNRSVDIRSSNNITTGNHMRIE